VTHWGSGFPINAAVLEGPQGQRVIQFELPGAVIQQVPAPAWAATPTAIAATYHPGQGVRFLIGHDNGDIVEQAVLPSELAPHQQP
jgi:hypothetical protein